MALIASWTILCFGFQQLVFRTLSLPLCSRFQQLVARTLSLCSKFQQLIVRTLLLCSRFQQLVVRTVFVPGSLCSRFQQLVSRTLSLSLCSSQLLKEQVAEYTLKSLGTSEVPTTLAYIIYLLWWWLTVSSVFAGGSALDELFISARLSPVPSSPVVVSVNVKPYWAIQAGLLTPLTSARHRLSPLAAFTSGAYFLHNGRR